MNNYIVSSSDGRADRSFGSVESALEEAARRLGGTIADLVQSHRYTVTYGRAPGDDRYVGNAVRCYASREACEADAAGTSGVRIFAGGGAR
jgi:hypothetical protein